jgi:hypothetical protein
LKGMSNALRAVHREQISGRNFDARYLFGIGAAARSRAACLARLRALFSLSKMVDATGIEPVTPSMSTRCSPAELRVRSGEPR